MLNDAFNHSDADHLRYLAAMLRILHAQVPAHFDPLLAHLIAMAEMEASERAEAAEQPE